MRLFHQCELGGRLFGFAVEEVGKLIGRRDRLGAQFFEGAIPWSLALAAPHRHPTVFLADGFAGSERLHSLGYEQPDSTLGLSSFLCEVVVHVVGSRRPGKVMANALSACFHPWVPVPSSPPLLFPMLRIAK